MTTLRYHRLSVRRFTKTLINYIFSESLLTEKYETVFRYRKKGNFIVHVENIANVFQKYVVHKIGSAPLENGLESKMNITPNSSHLCLKHHVSELFYLAVCFLHLV